MKTLFKALTAVALLGAGMSTAVAGDTPLTWQLDNKSNLSGTVYAGSQQLSDNYGWSYNTSAGGLDLNVTAWANFQDGVEQVAVGTWANYGMGVLNQSNDQHVVDNYGKSDFLLFSFSEAVKITDINIGWVNEGKGSDVSIANFDSLNGINSSSWSTVVDSAIYHTSFANVATTPPDLSVFEEAQYWLIGAYNNVFGGSSQNGYDKFKLLALTTHNADEEPPVDVSAPGTAILLTLGVGLIALRRRQK